MIAIRSVLWAREIKLSAWRIASSKRLGFTSVADMLALVSMTTTVTAPPSPCWRICGLASAKTIAASASSCNTMSHENLSF